MSEQPQRKRNRQAADRSKRSRTASTRARRSDKTETSEAPERAVGSKKRGVTSKVGKPAQGRKAGTESGKVADVGSASAAQNNGRLSDNSGAGKKRPGAQRTAAKAANTAAPRNKRGGESRSEPTTSSENAAPGRRARRLPKTHLSAKELREFQALLLDKRAEICGDVEQLTDEALYRSSNGERDNAAMPIHMADLGSDNWEQDFTLNLLANERQLVREIDEALARIQNKTFGICLATHAPIGVARLRAKPWAKYCIEYARAKEEGRV